jgi:hypothetical protein
VDSSARRPDLASLSCSCRESRLDSAALGSRRTSGDRGLSIRLGAEMDHVVGGKFKLGKKIGSGSFGELFLGEFPSLSSTPPLRGLIR